MEIKITLNKVCRNSTNFYKFRDEAEHQFLKLHLWKNLGSVTETASRVGMSRASLEARIRKLDLRPFINVARAQDNPAPEEYGEREKIKVRRVGTQKWVKAVYLWPHTGNLNSVRVDGELIQVLYRNIRKA